MTRKISIIAVALVAFVFGVGLSGMSEAQDCPRGDLDKAYCDRNGDLVADTPPTRRPSIRRRSFLPIRRSRTRRSTPRCGMDFSGTLRK